MICVFELIKVYPESVVELSAQSTIDIRFVAVRQLFFFDRFATKSTNPSAFGDEFHGEHAFALWASIFYRESWWLGSFDVKQLAIYSIETSVRRIC